jgi:predicted ATP-grasp superfamily ATP-dependent carboligase
MGARIQPGRARGLIKMSRIFILDGHSCAALAFTRSLGRAGHQIFIGVDHNSFSAASFSRYSQRCFRYSPAPQQPEAFAEEIISFCKREEIDLLIPMTDWTMVPISRVRDRFPAQCAVALPPEKAMFAAADKFQTVELARSLGIPIPRTELVSSVGELEQLTDLSFPVVVKDRYSIRWTTQGGVAGSVRYAYDRDELAAIVNTRLEVVQDVLLQEFVHGTGLGLAGLVAPAQLRIPFEWQRIREINPSGSASSARRSVPLQDDMLKYSEKLLVALGFRGLAMVEFKRETKSGRAVFMEVNGRPWGSMQLSIFSGIDFPKLLVQSYAQNELPPEHINYKTGITCRWLLGDLIHFTNVMAGRPRGWPGVFPRRISTALKLIVPWYPGLRYEDFAGGDLKPGFAALKNWFKQKLIKPKTVVAHAKTAAES